MKNSSLCNTTQLPAARVAGYVGRPSREFDGLMIRRGFTLGHVGAIVPHICLLNLGLVAQILQHIGAKRSVLWPAKYSKIRTGLGRVHPSLLGRGHPSSYPSPYLTLAGASIFPPSALATRRLGLEALFPKYFPLEPCLLTMPCSRCCDGHGIKCVYFLNDCVFGDIVGCRFLTPCSTCMPAYVSCTVTSHASGFLLDHGRIRVVVVRPHRSTTYVDAAYCYRPSSVVCRSVCLSHYSESCKNG